MYNTIYMCLDRTATSWSKLAEQALAVMSNPARRNHTFLEVAYYMTIYILGLPFGHMGTSCCRRDWEAILFQYKYWFFKKCVVKKRE